MMTVVTVYYQQFQLPVVNLVSIILEKGLFLNGLEV